MTQQSPVIDVHAHIVFEALHGAAGPHGPEAAVDEQGVNFFRIGEYQLKPLSYEGSVFIDMALRLAHMDRLGIDVQVLSANPLTMFHGIDTPERDQPYGSEATAALERHGRDKRLHRRESIPIVTGDSWPALSLHRRLRHQRFYGLRWTCLVVRTIRSRQ